MNQEEFPGFPIGDGSGPLPFKKGEKEKLKPQTQFEEEFDGIREEQEDAVVCKESSDSWEKIEQDRAKLGLKEKTCRLCDIGTTCVGHQLVEKNLEEREVALRRGGK